MSSCPENILCRFRVMPFSSPTSAGVFFLDLSSVNHGGQRRAGTTQVPSLNVDDAPTQLLRTCRNTWLHGIRVQQKVLAQSKVDIHGKVGSFCVPDPPKVTTKRYRADGALALVPV